MKVNTKNLLRFLVLVSVFLSIVHSKPTKKYRYDAEFLDSEIQRIRSGRAEVLDPVWNSKNKRNFSGPVDKPVDVSTSAPKVEVDPKEVEKVKNKSTPEDDESEGESSESESSSDDYYTSSEELEITCAPDKGWHIRGQRCVPLMCPGGPAERDFNTGECLYSSQPRGRFLKPFQQWNDLKWPRVQIESNVQPFLQKPDFDEERLKKQETNLVRNALDITTTEYNNQLADYYIICKLFD